MHDDWLDRHPADNLACLLAGVIAFGVVRLIGKLCV